MLLVLHHTLPHCCPPFNSRVSLASTQRSSSKERCARRRVGFVVARFFGDLIGPFFASPPSVLSSTHLHRQQQFATAAAKLTSEINQLLKNQDDTDIANVFAQRMVNDRLRNLDRSFLSDSPVLSGSEFGAFSV